MKKKPQPVGTAERVESTPESAWFFSWLKSAGKYLGALAAYLVTARLFVAGWKKFLSNSPNEAPDITVWGLALVLALPLFLAFFFNLLPAWHRRREASMRPRGAGRRGYFTTAPRDAENPFQLFGEEYEPFLRWARSPQAPLLHLTGLSGTGKSSLLSAYLEPQLRHADGNPGLIILRSYSDPLAALKPALLPLWKEKPEDYDILSPLETLKRADRQLADQKRLLIAFDQFEEYFLVRAAASESPEAAHEPVRDFLHAYLATPPKRITLLLSYREDHKRLLNPLRLPPRNERINAMTVDPLDFAAATRFLDSCPELSVPPDRKEQVLCEAARQEGGRVVMRPIVANLLGLVLQRMSDHPTLWRRSGDLLRGYVQETLRGELQEDRARALRALLTDFHTARPRPLAQIAQETGWDASLLDNQFEILARAGLLRCLSENESSPELRVWQISHDFLAALIERVLDGFHRTFLRTARPWLAPSAIVLAMVCFVVQPWLQKKLDIAQLAKAGFVWKENEGRIEASFFDSMSITTLEKVGSALHRLRPSPKVFFLGQCGALRNIDALKGLTPQAIDLHQTALQNVDALRGLVTLQSLSLRACLGLTNVDGLQGLTALTHLDLSNCPLLQNVDPLKGLISLQSLELQFSDGLRNVGGLNGLTELRNLDLLGCTALQNVNGLKGLPKLQHLNLRLCKALTSVDGLRGLSSLQILVLYECHELQSVDGLQGLPALQSLDLRGCPKLQNVHGLQELTALQILDLSGCAALQSLDGLQSLTSIKRMEIRECVALRDVRGLHSLTWLQFLNLKGSTNISASGVTALRIALPKTQIIGP